MTLVTLALLTTAGCTSVTPPDRLPPRQPPAPAGGGPPSLSGPRTPPAVQPSARDALVKSSTRKPKPAKAQSPRSKTPAPKKPAAVDYRHPAQTPPRPPVPPVRRTPAPPRPVTQQPQRRPEPVTPRPVRPRQTYDGKIVCRMANGVADPATVALCREQLGR
ncbi:hypothetical protein [Streptomyces longisporoflavus]|uniref:hypothetical protein n=1 Tax=Streptomyces longisporoflavus TaxID=28044 RepID=UPI00167D7AA6|nr:hypothetical protein [Streptomyces longisporoflavus]